MLVGRLADGPDTWRQRRNATTEGAGVGSIPARRVVVFLALFGAGAKGRALDNHGLAMPPHRWFNRGMTRSVAPKRIAVLILALLVVIGPRSRAQPVLATPDGAIGAWFPVVLCHSGSDHRRPVDRPASGCDACLLCVVRQGHHDGTLLLPANAGLPPMSAAVMPRPLPTGGVPMGKAVSRCVRARAPPPVA